MINPVDILNSWKKANHPTTQEEQLANERASICMQCPSRVKDDSLINLLISKQSLQQGFKCGECECPLSKKIYSQFGCPLDKW